MSVVGAQLVTKIAVEDAEKATQQVREYGKTVDQAQAQSEKASGGIRGMFTSALSFAAGGLIQQGLGILTDQIKGIFTESMNAQAGMAQTNKVLESTHDASGMTANAIADLATQYSHLTKFSDDTVQASENMLLTFTNIGKNVFPQATKTVLDMSQALGQDTKSSAIQLGKALNDPIAGITALQRVGVTFNQAQKDQIKSFMDTNNIAGAQGVILKELQKEFGGSAEAAGKTFGGQLAIAQQHLDDLKQAIGDRLMPILANLLDFVQNTAAPAIGEGFQRAMEAVKPFLPVIQQLATMVQGNLAQAFAALKTYAMPTLQQIAGIVGGQLKQDFQTFMGIAQNLAGWWQSTMVPAIKQAMPGFEALGNVLFTKVIPAMAQLWAAGHKIADALMPVFIKVFETVEPIIVRVGGFISGILAKAIQFLLPYVMQATTQVVKFAQEISTRVMPIISKLGEEITIVLGFIMKHWNQIWGAMAPYVMGVFNVIKGIIQIAWSVITGIFKIALDIISGNWGQAWTDMKAMVSGIWAGIKSIVAGGVDVVIGIINGMINGFNSIGIDIGPVHIHPHIPNIPLLAAGTDFWQGGAAIVGERGPELAVMPRGTRVVPNNQLGSAGGTGQPIIVQPPDIHLDGVRLSRGLMPYVHNAITYGVGGFGR